MGLFFVLIIGSVIVMASAAFLMLGIVVFFSLFDYFGARIRRIFLSVVDHPMRAATIPKGQSISPALPIAWCLLPPASVLATFIGLSGAGNREWDRFIASYQHPAQPIVVAAEKLQTGLDMAPKETIESPADVLPDWISSGARNDGDVQTMVLTSRLWSSLAEAEKDLKNQTLNLIQSDFRERHKGLLDPNGDQYLKMDQIIATMVKQRHTTQSNQDFGNFTAPMYRVWWQVELSPVVRTELYPEWKSAALQNRILFLGGILSMLTLVGSSFNLHANLKRFTNAGPFKRFASCSFPVLTWIAVELLIALRLMS